jgi:hypothetical protein
MFTLSFCLFSYQKIRISPPVTIPRNILAFFVRLKALPMSFTLGRVKWKVATDYVS